MLEPGIISFHAPQILGVAQQQGKRSLLGKALGMTSKTPPKRVLDATAGLGRDGLAMACLGLTVTLLERSPGIAAGLQTALAEGLAFAQAQSQPKTQVQTQAGTQAQAQTQTPPTLLTILNRITVIQVDARSFLRELVKDSGSQSQPQFDVIYLDPMFPDSNKKRLSKKPMQVLEQIVGDDPDADELLPLAQQVAKNRVVVKRHQHSPWLANQKPTMSFFGKSHRFDVYLIGHALTKRIA